MSIYKNSKPASTVTHFLQQGHTYYDEATPPNSANPYEASIQTHESIGAIPIQTIALTFRSPTIVFSPHILSLAYKARVFKHYPPSRVLSLQVAMEDVTLNLSAILRS